MDVSGRCDPLVAESPKIFYVIFYVLNPDIWDHVVKLRDFLRVEPGYMGLKLHG